MPDDQSRQLIDELRREINTAQFANMVIMEATKRELAVLQGQIMTFEKALLERVQRLEFIPVKLIAYALAGGTLTTVLGAVLSKIIIK